MHILFLHNVLEAQPLIVFPRYFCIHYIKSEAFIIGLG